MERRDGGEFMNDEYLLRVYFAVGRNCEERWRGADERGFLAGLRSDLVEMMIQWMHALHLSWSYFCVPLLSVLLCEAGERSADGMGASAPHSCDEDSALSEVQKTLSGGN